MPRLHDHRRPFSAEFIIETLNKSLLSPLPTAALVGYLASLEDIWSKPSPVQYMWQHYAWIVYFVIFVALKQVNAVVGRYVANDGWFATRPQWKKEIVVVTGGSSGIGKEVVGMLLRGFPGVRVAVLDIAEPTEWIREPHVAFYKANVADAEQVRTAAEHIREELGEPTMLVSNAGIVRAKNLLEMTTKEFETTLGVNLVGAFNVVKEFLPAMVSKNRGHVVTVSSAAAFLFPPGMSDYCASKSGLLAFHEVLTAELRERYDAPKVRTTCIASVKVATGIGKMVGDLAGAAIVPTQEPWQVAERIVEALDSGLSGGTVFVPSFLGLALPGLRAFPTWVYRSVAASLNLGAFANTATRERGTAAGYKILADE